MFRTRNRCRESPNCCVGIEGLEAVEVDFDCDICVWNLLKTMLTRRRETLLMQYPIISELARAMVAWDRKKKAEKEERDREEARFGKAWARTLGRTQLNDQDHHTV